MSAEDLRKKPINWARLQPGYKIINLSKPYYDRVIDLVKENYLSNDVIMKYTEMAEDETSLNSFLEHVLFIMNCNQSIIILNEKDDAVIGTLLLNVITKLDFGVVYSRHNVNHGDAYNKYIDIKTALNRKADIFLDCNCDYFMRFYLLCVKAEELNTKFGYYLLRCGIEVCRALHIPVACGIFPSIELQKCAGLVGFKVLHMINYVDWVNKEGDMIFDDPGLKGSGCALMVADVPAPYVVPLKLREVPRAAEKKDKKDKKK